MGFAETGEHIWRAMSISERVGFLDRLASEINRKPEWWNGLTFEAIARISSYDDLPSDLRGRMIMAMTEDGFSIEELRKEQTLLGHMIEHPRQPGRASD